MSYCRRCKKEVGSFHRCFYGRNAIIALEKPPDPKKRISHKLLERIKSCELLPFIQEDAYIAQLRPGNNERSQGAWLWSVENNGVHQIGSCSTMKECLSAKKWTIYRPFDWCEIIPE